MSQNRRLGKLSGGGSALAPLPICTDDAYTVEEEV